MSDYSDYRKWKEVVLYTKEVYLQSHEEYTPEVVKSICDNLIEVGKEEGLEGCYLRFNSNRDPYEDYLGLPSVLVCGYRKLNVEELEEFKLEKELEDVAKKLNIAVYEARVLKKLQDKLGGLGL